MRVSFLARFSSVVPTGLSCWIGVWSMLPSSSKTSGVTGPSCLGLNSFPRWDSRRVHVGFAARRSRQRVPREPREVLATLPALIRRRMLKRAGGESLGTRILTLSLKFSPSRPASQWLTDRRGHQVPNSSNLVTTVSSTTAVPPTLLIEEVFGGLIDIGCGGFLAPASSGMVLPSFALSFRACR